jgi:hypothetical protein
VVKTERQIVFKQPTHALDEPKDNIRVEVSHITRGLRHLAGTFLEGVRVAI